jgi:TIR domain
MHVFLSYASTDCHVAEQVHLALLGAGYAVFFDQSDLPPGGDYNERIFTAVAKSEVMVFLMSKASVKKGSYVLTELKYARQKWPHPKGRVLPVRLDDVPFEAIPSYLKAVTVLQPEGNLAAEVRAEVVKMAADVRMATEQTLAATDVGTEAPQHSLERSHKITVPIVVAVLGLVGVISTAILANWPKLSPSVEPVAKEKDGLDKRASSPPSREEIVRFVYGSGSFEKAGEQWVEKNRQNEVIAQFEILAEDAAHYYLVDRTRSTAKDNFFHVRLPKAGGPAHWSWQNPIVWTEFAVVSPRR